MLPLPQGPPEIQKVMDRTALNNAIAAAAATATSFEAFLLPMPPPIPQGPPASAVVGLQLPFLLPPWTLIPAWSPPVLPASMAKMDTDEVPERRYVCDLCQASYSHRKSLHDHKLKHSGKFPCPHCTFCARKRGELM